MENSSETTQPPQGRVEYYQLQADKLLKTYGKEFIHFVKGQEGLVDRGNKLLGKYSGYNILLSKEAMPLDTGEHLIFYNNYIGRPWHFGLLLAEMEIDGIISPEQVRLGAKASRVNYDGSWEIDPSNEVIRVIKLRDKEGRLYDQEVDETVEIIAIFSPSDPTQAISIAKKLIARIDGKRAGAIKGSWDIPDIRATSNLKKVLERIIVGKKKWFKEINVNIFSEEESQLIVATPKKDTGFDKPWETVLAEMNWKLADYLATSARPS